MTEQIEKPRKRQRWPLAIGLVAAVASATPVWVALDHFSPGGTATPPVSTSTTSSPPQVFTSDEFGFSAKFPGEPARQDQEHTLGGQKLRMTMFSAGKPDAGYNVATVAAACTPTGKDIDARLKASADGTVTSAACDAGSTSTVASQKPVTVHGHPGMQTDFTLAKGGETLHMMTAVVINGPRFYTVMATNPAAEGWDEFLGSFTITKDPAVLPECAPLSGT